MDEIQYRRRDFLKYAAKIGLGAAAALSMADKLFSPALANTQIATDNFTRANANPIGGNWTTAAGFQPLQVLSNTGRGTSNSLAGAAYWNANTFLPGVYSEFAMTTKVSGSSACLFARAISDLSSGYEILFNGTFGAGAIGQIKKANGNGLPGNPAAFTTTINSGDIVRLSCQGTSIAMLVNGALAGISNQAVVRDYLFQGSGLSGVRLVPGSSVNDIQLTDWASGFEGDPRFVQQLPFGLDAPPQSVVTVTPTVTSGDLMLVLFGSGDQALPPVVTSPGDTWNILPVQFSVVFNGWFFWAIAKSGGAKTITVTKNAGVAAGHMAGTYGEYNVKNAVLSSTPVVATATSTSAAATVTGVNSGDLLIAFESVAANPPTIGLSGMAYRGGGPLGNGSNPTGAFDEIGLFDGTASAGSNTATLAIGTSKQWEMILASFSGPSGFGGTTTAGPTKTAGPTVKQ